MDKIDFYSKYTIRVPYEEWIVLQTTTGWTVQNVLY